MRKLKIAIFIALVIFLISAVCISVSISEYGWPVFCARVIRGKIIDVTTGEPIENAVVTVTWHYTVWSGFQGTGSRDSKSVTTNEDGIYEIPKKIISDSFLIHFDFLDLRIYHPLYEQKGIYIGEKTFGRQDLLVPFNFCIGGGDKGNIRDNISLLSLGEKYQGNEEQAYNLYDEFPDWRYFKLAIELNVIDRLDWNLILREWEEIVERFPEGYKKSLLKERIKAVRDRLEEEGLR